MQSDQSVCSSLKYSLSVELLVEYLLEFLSLKEDCTGSSEMPLRVELQVAAQMTSETKVKVKKQ